MTLQALVWDVDGTLAETEDEGHRIAFNRAFEEAGLPWRWDRAVYGELLEHHRRQGAHAGLVAAHRPRGRRRAGGRGQVRRLHARKTAHYSSCCAHGAIALRPGVRRLMDEAQRQGLRQAIATTTSRTT